MDIRVWLCNTSEAFNAKYEVLSRLGAHTCRDAACDRLAPTTVPWEKYTRASL